MTWNIGDFIWSIIKAIVGFTQKLYDLVNLEIDMSWLDKLLKVIGIEANIGSFSLISIITTMSAGTILILIVYHLFK